MKQITGTPKRAIGKAGMRKLRWLSGGSAVAATIFLASMPQAARAQAFTPVADQALQANITSFTGGVAFDGPRTTDLDTITVSTSEAIINWQPLDTNAAILDTNGLSTNPINVLPSGRTLRFSSASVDYTVLNRILPSASAAGRSVQFNGAVESLVSGNPGGNVWFYSPGGIIAGAGSSFNVGSLVLTTNDIDTTGSLFGAGGTIRFNGISDSLSAVSIEDGATITATTNNSYVALVAPRVVQGGRVTVNGSAAYVAAEQVDLTIDNGLFDIAVTVGTNDGDIGAGGGGNGVVHTGVTTGASSVPIPDDTGTMTNEANRDAQAVYLVAVPKNDAITMLVGGELGYTAASDASIVNGEIVLSAGYNVLAQGSTQNAQVVLEDTPVNGTATNIEFTGGSFDADVIGKAATAINMVSDDANVGFDINGAINGDTYNLTLEAGTQIDIGAESGGFTRIAGNVSLRVGTSDATGGNVNIIAVDDPQNPDALGLFSVGGNLVVDVSADGADDFVGNVNNGGTGIGEDAIAGTIDISVSNGGEFSVDGDTEFSTNAQGGKGEVSHGLGRAGDINISLVGETSNITLLGAVDLNAQTRSAIAGKSGGTGASVIGNDSISGNITFDLQGGSMETGRIDIDADAVASSGSNASVAQSNDATAGNLDFNIAGGTHTFGALIASSRAQAAASFDDVGNPVFGLANTPIATLQLVGDGTTLNVTDNVRLSAVTTADVPMVTGIISVTDTGSTGGLFVNNGLSISASGDIDVTADNGTIDFGSLSANTGSDFDGIETIVGGDINIISRNGGDISGQRGSFGASSNATGFSGTTVNAVGGNILIFADNSSISFTDSLFAEADGRGSVDGDSTGTGGTIRLLLQGASGSMTLGDLSFSTDGSIFDDVESGAAEPTGNGGDAFGGTVTLDLLGGTFIADDITVQSNGFAGFAGHDMFGNAADGGDATGGDVIVNLNGSSATIDTFSVVASGLGGSGTRGDDSNGEEAGNGGAGIGGNATFNATSGTLDVNQLTVDALGNASRFSSFISLSGRGGRGRGTDGGDGGSGTGGVATFNLDGTSVINAQEVLISTSGYGGEAGSTSPDFTNTPFVPGGAAGQGADGIGGSATFNNTSGTISFNQLTVESLGIGSDGGSNSGDTTGTANANGGNGGAGIGGTATINLNQDDLTNPNYVVDTSATGGEGGTGLNAGNGGDATGGAALLTINDAQVSLNAPTIRSNASGGNGGFTDGDGGNGGDGGNATGGTATLQVTGANGSINIDTNSFVINADATGGNGSFGGFTFGAGTPGDGGDGGDGTGGSAQIVARTGGEIVINPISPSPTPTPTPEAFNLSSSGRGGNGGAGSSVDMLSGDAPGAGGNGGAGTGGMPTLLAQGGTITAGDINYFANGTGGNAGAGGGDGGLGILFGTDGIAGDGIGGTAILEVQEGSPGIINAGNVVAQTSGAQGAGVPPVGVDIVLPPLGTGISGRIEITDTSTDPAGLISLASLNASALGAAAPTSGFFMTGNSGPITVTGDVTIDVAGNAEFIYDGDGQLVVGGLMDVMSGASILVSHTNNTAGATTSIDVASSFDARAQSEFDSMTGSIINSDAAITIRAETNASAADLRALDNIDLSAGQNALLNNASVTGPAVTSVFSTGILVSNGINVRAGSNDDPTVPQFDPNFGATFTGDISSSGAIRIEAGGNAVFQTGTNLVSDNLLLVRTGDDIIIQSGASIAAANDPVETVDPSIPFLSENNLLLLAGDIGMGTPLLSAPLTPIASIVAAGNINANDFALVMTANAIDGLGGTISAGSISADINNAPSNATIAASGQSDDNGLLSAGCVEGNLCLGALTADNIVSIGQAGIPIQAIIENGDVVANSILISTRRDIVMGADGVPSRFIASDEIFVNSTEGDVDLRDAELTSGTLGVEAAGSLLGSGSLNSGNDIGITVGGDISAAAINTGGELTTSENRGDALEGFYSVPGSMNVGVLTVGAGDVNYDAGGDFSFDQINVPDTNIILDAPGSIFLGATSGARNIDINGGDITVGSIDAGVDINLSSGDFIDFGSVDAGDMLDLSGSEITGDVLAAGTTVRVEGTGSLSIGNVISGNETFLEGTSVTLGGADTGDNGDIRFTEGLRVRALDGDINITGDLDISRRGDFFASGDIVFGDVDVTSKILARLDLRSVGSVEFGNVTSDSFISVRADGNFTAETVAASSLRAFVDGLVDITRAEVFNSNFEADLGVEIGELIGGSAVLRSSDGDVAVRNNALVDDILTATGNNVFLRSDGAMRVRATANDGNIDIVTRGNLVVDEGSATGNIQLTSLGGSAELNELIIVPDSVSRSPAGISGQAVVSANGNIDITAAVDVAINDTVNAANALTITAGNLVDIQALATGTTIDVSSADINIGTAGQIGEFTQTNDIFIESNGTNQAILGGAGTTGVFSLNNDEFTRIQSNQDLTLFVAQTGNTTPDLIIQDLTIQAGSNVSGPQTATIGFSGTLTIDSGQSTRVDGNLNLTNASAGTTLNMTSVDNLRINANGGLIQITNASGSFGGVGLMSLTAQNIYAMTDQAFADIAGLDVNAVDLRLENSDGIDLDNGLIRGGIAQFVVDGDLFIQNTAPGVSFDERRGFTVDSLTINGLSAGSNANIVINGIVGGDTGIDTIFATDTVVGFDDFSTINGCVIIDPSSCGAPPPPTPTPTPDPTPDPEIEDPVQNIIEEEVTPSDDGSRVSDPFETNLIEIKDNEEYVDDPLIDDPVTGAGNDDLWVGEEDASDDENSECEDGDNSCGQGGPAQQDELEPAE